MRRYLILDECLFSECIPGIHGIKRYVDLYRLPDLWIRPSYGGKGRKVTGVLECHQNGFRYSLQRNTEQVSRHGNTFQTVPHVPPGPSFDLTL